ncbi:MAG: ABC transporter ATP-binding protein [Ruminococcus sp.]|nr:ABC transporter ATP-binding protein [Ruminococcus sp.]
MKAIETINLTKEYKDITAVDKLNLEVEKGELFALLGVNGAGKTTAIKMLTTLILPTSGSAIILGNDLFEDKSKVKRITNVSPQETAVATKLSVRENLEFIAGIYGANSKEAAAKAAQMMERFDMTEISDRKAGTLSGGWQRRLSIAMALISEPEILFLDEPTLGLDVLARRELWRIISSLKGKVTIILTTHYLEEARELSDRIGIMVKGKLKRVGTASELMEYTGADSFEDAFVAIAEEGLK